jgi:MFS family permease
MQILSYIGSFGTILAVMMISLCNEFYQFLLAQGVLLGISMSLVTWPMLALVGQHIKHKRALAMGIVLAGSSLGGVIWPIAIDKLLKSPDIGFSWTMRIVGFIMIPCLSFSCVAARSPNTPDAKLESGDRSRSLTNDNAITQTKDTNRKAEAIALYRKPEMQLLCIAMFITYFGMFSPFFYTTSYAVEKGFPSSFGFYTVSIVNGASIFGRILPGVVADKYGKFNCCIISTLVAGIVALCWTRVESVAGLGIWSAAYGFASGVGLPLILLL